MAYAYPAQISFFPVPFVPDPVTLWSHKGLKMRHGLNIWLSCKPMALYGGPACKFGISRASHNWVGCLNTLIQTLTKKCQPIFKQMEAGFGDIEMPTNYISGRCFRRAHLKRLKASYMKCFRTTQRHSYRQGKLGHKQQQE